MPVVSGCTEVCWTPVRCPVHDHEMKPLGRSSALEEYICCERYSSAELNPRHLWSEHDSTRHYTDPEGWAAHEATCTECRGDEDE